MIDSRKLIPTLIFFNLFASVTICVLSLALFGISVHNGMSAIVLILSFLLIMSSTLSSYATACLIEHIEYFNITN